MATKSEIKKVKEIDLMDLVMNSGIRYKQNNDHLKICCIFHNEKTPSLAIYPAHYFCYSCGAHGDILDWSMQAFEQTFDKAVKTLINYIKENENKIS